MKTESQFLQQLGSIASSFNSNNHPQLGPKKTPQAKTVAREKIATLFKTK